MLKTLAYATLFSTALAGSSALGEDNPAVPKVSRPRSNPIRRLRPRPARRLASTS